ncbi:AFG1-like ATPase [Chloropicon roscoffensis]|uniref:AFG1-like ATPase n=2 Tax=Chloropicon roscoffensis TaxID=1461544 RepID=A0AAX4PF50_9CHLO
MSVLQTYLRLVGRHASQGGLRRDAAQVAVAERLDGLLGDLGQHRVSLGEYEVARRDYLEELGRQTDRIVAMKLEQRRTGSAFPGFQTMPWEKDDREKKEVSERRLRSEAAVEAQNIVGAPPDKPKAPRSVYLHGHVGVGKTFLMDLFYEKSKEVLGCSAAGGSSVGARRMHFNSAMMELHQHMHRIERAYCDGDKKRLKDPGKLAVMAARRRRVSLHGGHKFGASQDSAFTVSTTLEQASRDLFKLNSARSSHLGLVCFDELQVPDGFTAISIMSMFRVLFQEEAVVISTSNCAPRELNDNAWFNDHYNNFTEILLDRCEVLELNNGVDYRTIGLEGLGEREDQEFRRFYYPLTEKSAALMDEYVREAGTECGAAADDGANDPREINVLFGRTLSIPTGGHRDVARFDFMDLFSKAVGPSDCLAVARSFKVVCIENVPVLSRQKRDQARRFITMVDELYNEGCLLVCTAEAPPGKLFKSDELGESLLDLESLQFEAEALTDAKSRVDSSEVGGVSPDAASQRMGTGGDAKFFANKMTGEEERFAFKRAVSRILEMQGDVYYRRHRKLKIDASTEDVAKREEKMYFGVS